MRDVRYNFFVFFFFQNDSGYVEKSLKEKIERGG